MELESSVKGVFLFGHHDRYPAGGDLTIDIKRLIRLLTELGANAVWVNLAQLSLPLVQSLHDAGIFVAASQNVFSLLAGESPESLGLEPPYWPVNPDGQELKGSRLCPTNPSVIACRRTQAHQAIERFGLDGLWLDSVRYPGHWESDVRKTLDTCYCERCQAFAKRASEIGHLPGRHLTEPWQVTAIRQTIEQLLPDEVGPLLYGLWQVPFTIETVTMWQEEFGQSPRCYKDFKELFISPMSYHQMMGESPDWVEETIRVYDPRVTGRYKLERLLPAIQAEDRPGAFPPEEISKTILLALRYTRGAIVFFLEALLEADGKPNIKFEMVRAAFRT